MSVRDAEPREPPSWPPSPLLVRVIRDPLPDAEELADQLRDRFTVLGFEGFEVDPDAPPSPKAPADLAALLPDWLGDTPETEEALAAAAREPAPVILPPTSSELIRLTRSRRATLAGRSYMHGARQRRLSRRARGRVLGLTTTLALILAGASATVVAALAIQEISSKEVTPVAGGFPAVSFLGQEEAFARGYPATAFLRNDSTLASTPPGGFVAATAKESAERAGGGDGGSDEPSSSEPSTTSVNNRASESSGGSSDRPSKPGRSESKPERRSSSSAPAPAPRRQSAPAPAPRRQAAPAPAPRRQAAPAPAPRQAPAPQRQPQPRIQPADPPPSSSGGNPSLGSSPSL
jgi:hypothetical protein